MDRSIDDKMRVIQQLRETADTGAGRPIRTTGESRSTRTADAGHKEEHFMRRICTGLLIRLSIAGFIFIAIFLIKDKQIPAVDEICGHLFLSEEAINENGNKITLPSFLTSFLQSNGKENEENKTESMSENMKPEETESGTPVTIDAPFELLQTGSMVELW